MIRLILLAYLGLTSIIMAQTTPPLGPRHKTPQFFALTNARIILSPDRTLERGVVVCKDGRIIDVGENISIPAGATVTDLTGKTIYPGFIDPSCQFGLQSAEKQPPPRWNRAPVYEIPRTGGNAWNDAIHAQENWVDAFKPDIQQVDGLLKQGITAVQSCRMDGIFRGNSFVTLVGDGIPNDLILKGTSLPFASFNKGTSIQDYPSSLMGSIALIRQTLLDVDWYRRAQAAYALNPNQKMPEFNRAIEALEARGTDPIVFETDDEHSLLRAAKIGAEFNIPMVHIGSGFEYRRLGDIAALKQPVILPVNFPKSPQVGTSDDELDVSLDDLRHWDWAPSNARLLDSAQVQFAFTTLRLKDNSQFLTNVRRTVRRGLSPRTALAALTTVPARLCGVDKEIGSIDKGKLADFIITNGDIFADSTRIYGTWVKGIYREQIPLSQADFRGEYTLTLGGKSISLNVKGDIDRPQGEFKSGVATVALENIALTPDELTFSARLDSLGWIGVARFSARKSNTGLTGLVSLPGGSSSAWTATLSAPYSATAEKAKAAPTVEAVSSRLTYPDMAYGFSTLPRTENVLVKNATIWTGEKEGILEHADLLVQNGKFAKIGTNLTAPAGTRTIDATDKHLTAGVIDEHSHICIFGDVNEGTAPITAEVRIGDVVDPDDINMYRAVAAGVTTLQLLHGSANPIGGQAQIIKPRWGSDADGMKFAGVTRTIKFALGENVKQSNWGEQFTTRYPQTRMGVETIVKDAFQSAREYESAWKTYDALGSSEKQRTVPPRRDLTLEAVDDVINSRLLVHCHSYVETEILMLMRLAEQFGFKIQTFTHILEGYKVADEMAAHGTTASSFADWWAFKFEVYDAIPYNTCILHDRGVITSVNSDSPEAGRRLNQEAAKSIMYCGMSPEEAEKMFTLNSAIQLKIDDRVGSIKVGKDADFVIWNANPLSIYAKAEQTWIDGKQYFDIVADSLAREADRLERAALVQKVLATPQDLAPPGSRDGLKEPRRVWHCDDVMDYWKELNAYRSSSN